MRRAVAVYAFALAGCYAGDYSTLTKPFVGTRASVGCIDVAVALTEDQTAPGPIVAYQFGNHCFHQAMIDFTAVSVVATTHDGTKLELQAHDPRGEIKPMQIDAWTAGDERIAYDTTGQVDQVCVDLGRFDGNRDAGPYWKCMGANR
jgi:hypothetical protein